jgi:hypothetical protein
MPAIVPRKEGRFVRTDVECASTIAQSADGRFGRPQCCAARRT